MRLLDCSPGSGGSPDPFERLMAEETKLAQLQQEITSLKNELKSTRSDVRPQSPIKVNSPNSVGVLAYQTEEVT